MIKALTAATAVLLVSGCAQFQVEKDEHIVTAALPKCPINMRIAERDLGLSSIYADEHTIYRTLEGTLCQGF